MGSSSLLTFGNGQASPGDKVNGTETRYYPYGSHRLTPTTQLTERDFTGQRENLELGLVYYNARFYVPGLGRFLTADTIVPDPVDPQAYNRYSYVHNNPVNFTDSSGHCDDQRQCAVWTRNANTVKWKNMMNAQVDVAALESYFASKNTPVYPTVLGMPLFDGQFNDHVSEFIVEELFLRPLVSAYDAASSFVSDGLDGTIQDKLVASGYQWDMIIGEYLPGAMAVVGTAEIIASPYFAVRGGMLPGPCSFSEDTLVTTEEGLVPISEIEEGDYVLAYHEETGEVGYYPVTETWVHEDPVLTYLVIEGEFIATTPNHPFYTTEGWVEAGELGEDAYVVRAGGAPGQVWESLTFTLPRQMYDLTVAEAHTFFVGEEQWLVHNCDSVTVGRWMSNEELVGMQDTGMVQESFTGTTHVAYPANASSYRRQASQGSVYVEFDVPKSSLTITDSTNGWASIHGPNSLVGRNAALRGRPIPQMPPAQNIRLLDVK